MRYVIAILIFFIMGCQAVDSPSVIAIELGEHPIKNSLISSSPDGKHLIYYNLIDRRLTRLQLDNGKEDVLSLLRDDLLGFNNIEWFDDNQLAYTRLSEVNTRKPDYYAYEIVLFDLESNEQKVIMEGQQSYDICYLPSENSLIYVTLKDSSARGDYDWTPLRGDGIKAIDLLTNQIQTIYEIEDGQGSITDIACNPISSEIALVHHNQTDLPGAKNNVIILNLENGSEKIIIARKVDHKLVSWSQDGKWLAEKQTLRAGNPGQYSEIHLYSFEEQRIVFEDVVAGIEPIWFQWMPNDYSLLIHEGIDFQEERNVVLVDLDFLYD